MNGACAGGTESVMKYSPCQPTGTLTRPATSLPARSTPSTAGPIQDTGRCGLNSPTNVAATSVAASSQRDALDRGVPPKTDACPPGASSSPTNRASAAATHRWATVRSLAGPSRGACEGSTTGGSTSPFATTAPAVTGRPAWRRSGPILGRSPAVCNRPRATARRFGRPFATGTSELSPSGVRASGSGLSATARPATTASVIMTRSGAAPGSK